MKKIFLAVILILSLTACNTCVFNGSRTGNESQFIMEYTILNKTDSQALVLEKGDSIAVEIVSDAGELSIKIQKDDDPPIYRADQLSQSCAFQVIVEEAGTYTVTVTGDHAKGSVSFIRQTAPNSE